ncbi:MAG: YitT family protein [Erysipelotrichales bacterium]|nr:YitT family protein [Erysipelotrichales bacterium]
MNKTQLNMLLSVLVGNFILTLGVVCFVLPHGLIMGGVTGLALAFEHYLNVPLTIAVYLITVLVLLVSYIGMGKEYLLSMIAASLTYPLILQFLQEIPFIQSITDDVLLSTIFAALALGIGTGIIMKSGAGAGGLDCISLIVNKYFHLPIASTMRIVDISVLLLQIAFSTPEQILYGILLILITTFAVNYVLVSGKSQIQIMIISKNYNEILNTILSKIDVGATLLDIETGYTREKSQAVLVITSNRRVHIITSIAHEIDPTAFITISNTNEVLGKGFTLER